MARFTLTPLFGIILATLMFSAPASAHQPGAVNCYKPASQSAHAVCSSKRLMRVDQRMNVLFRDARHATETRYQLQHLHDTQRTFVVKRARCNGARFCIWWRTKQRIRQLNRFMRHI